MGQNDNQSKVIINGNIITMNPDLPVVQAIGILGDKIACLGTNEEVVAKLPGALVWDADGMTVLPGFIDNHVHFLQTGYGLISLDLVECNSWDEIVDAVAREALVHSPLTMIRGYGYDDHLFPKEQAPNRWDLDGVAPEHMVWLNRVDFHSSIVNSRTLAALNLPPDLPGIELDDQGVPTGVLRAEADVMARKLSSSLIAEEEKHYALRAAGQLAVAGGITTVAAMEGDVGYGQEDIKFLLKYSHESKARLEVFYQSLNVELVKKIGLNRIGGCVLLDGSFGSWSAALSEPYCDHDEHDWRGFLYLEQEQVNDYVLKAHQEGLQVTMHAIGDLAIERILTAYKLALEKYPVDNHRHRIEHFELPTKEHIALAGKLGIILSMQPAFEYYWGGADNLYGMRLGAKRVRRTNPFRDLHDAGITIAAGSDAAVTPMNPFYGIYAAVCHPSFEQQITRYEALKMFTINGAIALGIEEERGSIKPGKLADLVMLKENPLTVLPEQLKDLQVEATWVAGEEVYKNETIIIEEQGF